MGFAAWVNMTVDKETNDAVEKVYKQGKRTIRENYRKDGSHMELTVVLENGLIVEVSGDKTSLDKVRQALSGVDLAKMESAQRPAKS